MIVSTSFRLMLRIAFTVVVLFITGIAVSQKRWDGGAGDGLWATATNWADDIIPGPPDEVILDNSLLAGNYSVQLPIVAVTISRLIVSPSLPASINVLLPSSNTSIPALTVSGVGGIVIGNNAVFINSSGGSPGTAIVVADSIYINNGGRFVHATGNGHASYISKLSRSTGTESGTFEFDVPGPASYTISLAGRTYGNLELSAGAAGGSKSYLSNGSTNALIRGDCRINAGVNYSLDFTGEISIKAQLINYGNFNLASGSNNNTVKVGRHFYCFGTITETAAGQPVLEMNGNSNQNISASGNIINSIILRINNPAGITLTGPVSLPYKLELLNGIVNTTSSLLLTLLAGCSITVDSSSTGNFINGPLRKLGLSGAAHFIFPVGKGNTQRWLALKNATGDFTVEFYKNSPYSLANGMSPGIDHVSSIEYWSVDATTAATARVELSFNDVNSGGVTDLSTLRVAQLSASTWVNAGNVATTGSAGASGSVVSGVISVFGPLAKYLTLASSASNQNPLPVKWVKFGVKKSADGLHFSWEIPPGIEPDYAEIEHSADGKRFILLKKTTTGSTIGSYFLSNIDIPVYAQFYRLKLVKLHVNDYYSKPVPTHSQTGVLSMLMIGQTASSSHLLISLSSPKSEQLIFYFINNLGQKIKKISVQIRAGNQHISLPVYDLRAGYYQVFGLSSSLGTNPLIFIKPYSFQYP